MLCSLIAAALTFTATATGVEKGTAVEFFFAGKNTDRDYETMFLLDESIDSFCSKLEKARVASHRTGKSVVFGRSAAQLNSSPHLTPILTATCRKG